MFVSWKPFVGRLALCLAGLAAAFGCSAHRNLDNAYTLKQAPRIELLLDIGVDASHSETVHTDTVRGIVLRIEKNAPLPFDTRIKLRIDGGATRELLMVVPEELEIPIRSGERIIIHTVQKWDKNARQLRQAFHIQDGKKETRLIYQIGQLLPAQHIPSDLVVTPGKRVRYTEAVRIDGMCFATIEHRDITLTHGTDAIDIQPGKIETLQLEHGLFQWMAVDNRITLDSNCDNYRDDALVWIAVRTESP